LFDLVAGLFCAVCHNANQYKCKELMVAFKHLVSYALVATVRKHQAMA